MEGPNEDILCIGEEEYRDPDERGLRYVETPVAVGNEMRFEPGALFGWGESSYVHHDELEFHFVVHVLNRLVESFPSKRGSEDPMPRDDRVPCSSERRNVERMMHSAYDLADVDARMRRVERVEEHPFL